MYPHQQSNCFYFLFLYLLMCQLSPGWKGSIYYNSRCYPSHFKIHLFSSPRLAVLEFYINPAQVSQFHETPFQRHIYIQMRSYLFGTSRVQYPALVIFIGHPLARSNACSSDCSLFPLPDMTAKAKSKGPRRPQGAKSILLHLIMCSCKPLIPSLQAEC